MLEINSNTTQRLGIADGDWVWIESLRVGKIKQRARLTDGITYNLDLEKESQPADTEIPSTPETTADDPIDLIEKSVIPDTILSRDYAWYYRTEWTWQLDIPEAAYDNIENCRARQRRITASM